MTPKRNLFLHLSALSDTEYNVYIEALRDIVDDGDGGADLEPHPTPFSDDELESRRVSLPVVRAWMKGRFRDLGSGEIDKVLHLFASQTPQKEMTGGQLLAALRLLMHVRRGAEVNEGNVFVQAIPLSPAASHFPTPLLDSGPAFEVELPTPDAPASPPNSGSAHTNPFFTGPFLRGTNAASLPPPQPSSDSPRRASLSSAHPVPPVLSKPRVDGVGVPPGSTNPFLQRAKTHSGTFQPNSSGSVHTPPLPPRKPSHMSASIVPQKPPPIPAKPTRSVPVRPSPHRNSSSNSASTSSPPQNAPPPPPHRVTPLMQQSLLASRVGASLKRAQDEAGRIRVLEVIRSSSDVSVPLSHGKERDRTQNSSRSPDKGGRRPVPRPPRAFVAATANSDSGAPSEASFAEVASAQLLSRSRARPRTTSPDSISRNSSASPAEQENEDQKSAKSRQLLSSEQFSPPPTHPARRPSVHSSSGRGRHIRSPSYQSFNAPPAPPAGASSFTKSISTSGISNQNSPSPSPSPSPLPVSPNNSRSMRSQSMHQPSSPTLAGRLTGSGMNSSSSSPLPPPRRKRPESAQFAVRPHLHDFDGDAAADLDPTSPFANSFGIRQRSGEDSGGGVVSNIAARFDNSSGYGRGKDKERDKEKEKEKEKDREPHAFATLQRTFSALHQRAQPAITRARFKAEAGLLAPRRGFVPNGRDYHMAGEGGDRLVSEDDNADEGAGMDFGPVTDRGCDEEDISGEDTIRGRGRGRNGRARDYLLERDELKLPEGEGWAQL